MPSLPDLPVELVHRIVRDHICRDDFFAARQNESTRTLARLCRVSRYLHEVATPLLYRSFWQEGSRYKFARTILSTPQLAKHVKILRIYNPGLGGSPHAPSQQEVQLMRAGDLLLRSVGLAFRESSHSGHLWTDLGVILKLSKHIG